jgi:hypothetical protein
MAKQLDVVPFGATYSRAAGLSFKPCPTAYLTISIFAVLHFSRPPDGYLSPTAMRESSYMWAMQNGQAA